MNKIVNLCDNIRGKVIFEVLSNYFGEYTGEEYNGELKIEEMEVYEIKCDCTRIFSNEPERIFCKTCWKFMEIKRKKVPMVFVEDPNGNEIFPICLRGLLPGYFPYFGIEKKFKNCIILLNDFYKLGEVILRSRNCKIFLLGRCLNCRKVDDRTKLLMIFFTSPFENVEIDGYMVKWAERILRRIESLRKKVNNGRGCGILENVVVGYLKKAEDFLKKMDFYSAGKIILEYLLNILEDFRKINYSKEEYLRSTRYYFTFLSKILKWEEEEIEEMNFDERILKAFELVQKTINDINFLLKRFPEKTTAYIKPPKEYFEYFNCLAEYISYKTGLNVKIVEKLPKKKKVKEVGIYLD